MADEREPQNRALVDDGYVDVDLGLLNKQSRRMGLDFFGNLPPEITIDILSRLPIRTIIGYKLVCKSWRDLLQSREFAACHLSKSASGMVITSGDPKYVEVYELFVDETDSEGHQLRYIPVTEFADIDFFDKSELQGSADGLLLLGPKTDSMLHLDPKTDSTSTSHYICNPVTREFMSLPDYPNHDVVYSTRTVVNSGFGVSKSGEYKVVRVLHQCVRDPQTDNVVVRITNSVCHIYTLGTSKWRSIADCAPLANDYYRIGVFRNGSLYWLVTDFQGSNLILCFDLDKETFSTISPPAPLSKTETCFGGLVSLGDCLCMFDNCPDDPDLVIWLIKECGDEKTWTKGFVISAYSDLRQIVYPIKIFRDGVILMVTSDLHVFYYKKEARTLREIDKLAPRRDDGGCEAIFHRLSFISLETGFPTEIVRRF